MRRSASYTAEDRAGKQRVKLKRWGVRRVEKPYFFYRSKQGNRVMEYTRGRQAGEERTVNTLGSESDGPVLSKACGVRRRKIYVRKRRSKTKNYRCKEIGGSEQGSGGFMRSVSEV